MIRRLLTWPATLSFSLAAQVGTLALDVAFGKPDMNLDGTPLTQGGTFTFLHPDVNPDEGAAYAQAVLDYSDAGYSQ